MNTSSNRDTYIISRTTTPQHWQDMIVFRVAPRWGYWGWIQRPLSFTVKSSCFSFIRWEYNSLAVFSCSQTHSVAFLENLTAAGLHMAKSSDLECDWSCVWQAAFMYDAVICPARHQNHNFEVAWPRECFSTAAACSSVSDMLILWHFSSKPLYSKFVQDSS